MTSISGKGRIDHQKLTAMVIELITATLGRGRVSIGPSTLLLSGSKVFDSHRLMEFILRLEDTFDIHIPDKDLDPDIFESPRSIVRYLSSRLDKKM
jgi:acyl carrier protein